MFNAEAMRNQFSHLATLFSFRPIHAVSLHNGQTHRKVRTQSYGSTRGITSALHDRRAAHEFLRRAPRTSLRGVLSTVHHANARILEVIE